jgi:hypothetical protein
MSDDRQGAVDRWGTTCGDGTSDNSYGTSGLQTIAALLSAIK